LTTTPNNIREYESADKAQVLLLLRLNTPAFFAAREEEEFERYLEKEKEDYFVLESGGQIVACGGVNLLGLGEYARISWDMVHPQFQKKGLGFQLLKFRIQYINTRYPLKKIVVRTSQLAYKFYERAGFVVEKKEKDFWAPGFDLVYMVYN
jgi:ribosomal-protein-alanine N-acetyltransferase